MLIKIRLKLNRMLVSSIGKYCLWVLRDGMWYIKNIKKRAEIRDIAIKCLEGVNELYEEMDKFEEALKA